MARLDRWREPMYFSLMRTGSEPFQPNDALDQLLSAAPRRSVDRATWGTWGSIIGTARELILRVEGGKPILSVIGITLDEQHLDLVVQHTLELVDADENQLKRNLAYAAIFEVPVYPNDDLAAELLVRLHTELLTTGFVHDGEGASQRYRLNVPRAIEFADGEFVDGVADAGAGPVEVLLIRAHAARRQAEQDEASRVLGTLRSAISELGRLLDVGTRDEAALQQCLTSYPILFGLEYQRIIPKHSFGGEFEVDLALLRHFWAY